MSTRIKGLIALVFTGPEKMVLKLLPRAERILREIEEARQAIADLAGSHAIGSAHLAEALGYRGIDPRTQAAP